jgi:Protein involved in formate dehydrogenase formation
VTFQPAPLETQASPWAARRARARELRERHPFASELLTLYLALLPVQEDAWSAVRESPPGPTRLAGWAAAHVVPAVVQATVAAGPPSLGEAARGRLADGTASDALAGWLAGEELDPVDRYLARASLAPVLEALGEGSGAACASVAADGAACPRCGGLPQVSYVAATGESLVSGGRSLQCARCGCGWSCSRSICPACGESGEARLMTYAESWNGGVASNGAGNAEAPPMFPNLRIAGCETCHRYLIEVDLQRDARAVPEVDELTALPLDLHAADEGLTKLTPNLMGF